MSDKFPWRASCQGNVVVVFVVLSLLRYYIDILTWQWQYQIKEAMNCVELWTMYDALCTNDLNCEYHHTCLMSHVILFATVRQARCAFSRSAFFSPSVFAADGATRRTCEGDRESSASCPRLLLPPKLLRPVIVLNTQAKNQQRMCICNFNSVIMESLNQPSIHHWSSGIRSLSNCQFAHLNILNITIQTINQAIKQY